MASAKPISVDDLKERALEQRLFWLLDAKGARDVAWRVGGNAMAVATLRPAYVYCMTTANHRTLLVGECKGRTGTLDTDPSRSLATSRLRTEASKDYHCPVK